MPDVLLSNSSSEILVKSLFFQWIGKASAVLSIGVLLATTF
jgi:hypothetical protein